MIRISFLLIFTIAFSSHAFAQTKKKERPKRAIICLTYDDGLASQLSAVLPQLDAAGFKATFFLNSIQGSSTADSIGKAPEAVLAWSNAARNGHELANHTLFHPCPEKLGWDKSLAIEGYTIDKIIQEISAQNSLLAALDPTRTIRSFAFPCNNFLINGTDYSTMIADKKLVRFGRAGGDSNAVIKNFKRLNPMLVPSWHVWTGTTLPQLIAFAEKTKQAGGMGVYQFHGVGAQIFRISPETHRAFLEYLKLHEADYWVTTFSEAMEFVTK